MSRPIRDFLEIRTAAPANFSPDGARVLVGSNLTGTMQLYAVGSSGGRLEQLTSFDEPVQGMYLRGSGEIVLEMDAGGNERSQIYLLDPYGGNVRRVVYEPGFIHRTGDASRDGKTILYASNRRNGVDFDVFLRDLASGEEKCVFAEGGYCAAASLSPDARIAAVARPGAETGDNQMFLVDVATDEVVEVAPHDEPSFVGVPHWMPDGEAFFFATDIGREFSAVERYDLRARDRSLAVERDWDLRCGIDDAGRRLAVTANEDGYTSIRLFDPRTLAPLGEVPLPHAGAAGISGFSADGGRIAYTFVSPVEPGDAWVFDADAGRTVRLTQSPNPVPAGEFVEPELHRYTSFDGERIPVFLFRPRARGARAPVVVMIHGGPEGQFRPTFSPVLQYLVHRGYAVAAPNVRGSVGYGKRFHHLDDRRKRLDSVRDLEWLHRWLGTLAGVDASRAALWGGSYGGYMVLAGLAFQPDLWAAGVDIVGLSSLLTFLQNTSAYRRRFREREYGSLETDRDFLAEASPLTHVERMRAPLFIIHGTNDPRVPLGEAEQIHGALRAKGIPCELLVYPDEGHGLAKLANRLDAYPKATDFLDRTIGSGSG